MLRSIWGAFLALLFGTNMVVSQGPVMLAGGDTTLHAPRSISPVSDTMQVLIDLGAATEPVQRDFFSGTLDSNSFGIDRVSICDETGNCRLLETGGAFITSEKFGLVFAVSDQKLRGNSFVAVKIHSSRALTVAGVRWQNYSK